MRRIVSVSICVFLGLTAPAWANTFISDQYFFAVAATGQGENGSSWRTEVCLDNPYNRSLEVLVMAVRDGDNSNYNWVHLPAVGIVCYANILPNVLGISGSAMLLVAAREVDNPQEDNLDFVVSARVYNLAQDGATFGQDISPVNTFWDQGALVNHDDTGIFTGLWNYGGNTGFRTNIGFSSLSDYDQVVNFTLYDSNANVLWEDQRIVRAWDQIQFRIPQNIAVHGGSLYVRNGDLVVPYVSVVDNKSGDGLYRSMIKREAAKSTTEYPKEGLFMDRLRRLTGVPDHD